MITRGIRLVLALCGRDCKDSVRDVREALSSCVSTKGSVDVASDHEVRLQFCFSFLIVFIRGADSSNPQALAIWNGVGSQAPPCCEPGNEARTSW